MTLLQPSKNGRKEFFFGEKQISQHISPRLRGYANELKAIFTNSVH